MQDTYYKSLPLSCKRIKDDIKRKHKQAKTTLNELKFITTYVKHDWTRDSIRNVSRTLFKSLIRDFKKLHAFDFMVLSKSMTESIFIENCPSLRSGQFRGQKGLGTLEKFLEMPHNMSSRKKQQIILRTFRISSTLIVISIQLPGGSMYKKHCQWAKSGKSQWLDPYIFLWVRLRFEQT